MHGAVHDYIVVRTVKNGKKLPSAEEQFGGLIRDYVTYDFPELKESLSFKKMLDIGSLDICGSVISYNFIERGPLWISLVGNPTTIGIDLMGGSGVDRIMNAHDLQFPKESFDLVTCCNMIEHDSDPQKTLKEAYRVLEKDGVFILTTVNQNWEEHKHLGGGDTETYNHITQVTFKKWLTVAGFKDPDITEWKNNLFAFCRK